MTDGPPNRPVSVWPRGRGGKRPGAGRPRKRDWWTEFEIGQACEVLWREASEEAWKARYAALPYADEIQALQEAAQAIPVSQRKAWHKGEGYEDHSGDMEAWLHKRAETPFDESAGTYEGKAPRVVTLSTKPPRGTRKRIIGEVAARYGISSDTANRLWKAYRRLERELREAD